MTELPLRFMKVRRRPETIFRVGLLDRQSEVRFCVGFLMGFTNADGAVRFRRRKIFWLLSVWFHGCPLRLNYLTYIFDFPSTLSPKVYDGDSYLTSLGRMVTA